MAKAEELLSFVQTLPALSPRLPESATKEVLNLYIMTLGVVSTTFAFARALEDEAARVSSAKKQWSWERVRESYDASQEVFDLADLRIKGLASVQLRGVSLESFEQALTKPTWEELADGRWSRSCASLAFNFQVRLTSLL